MAALNPGILAFYLSDDIEMFMFLIPRNLIQDYVVKMKMVKMKTCVFLAHQLV
jgi:hypothetical protein